MGDYHINIFYSEEDGGYVADVPDLKSCSAFDGGTFLAVRDGGTTPVKALREALIARDAWLATARKNKKPIPEPRFRPAICAVRALRGELS